MMGFDDVFEVSAAAGTGERGPPGVRYPSMRARLPLISAHRLSVRGVYSGQVRFSPNLIPHLPAP